MKFYNLFEFLRELNANNHKDWMDDHRQVYEDIRDSYIDWLNEMDIKLSKADENYSPTAGREAITRINNNLLFHPDKPVYKDHFGAALDKEKGKDDFYIHIGINGSFAAGGFYRPKKEILDSIRKAIDYNGEELERILQTDAFKSYFGELVDDEKLKTCPKGYSKDHRFIELLRNKSFAVRNTFTQKEIQQDDFQDRLVEIYKAMLPIRNYLNTAVTV